MKKFYAQFVLAFAILITLVSICIGLSGITGCASVTSAVAPQVASAVQKYCATPLAERQVIRAQVNTLISPATIRVTCPGDPAP